MTHSIGKQKFIAGLILSLGVLVAGAEDPAVTRAREQAHLQYETEKAVRQAEEAKRKLAEQLALQRAIALTRQGVVSIYNPSTVPINYMFRWLLWDGCYTQWSKERIAANKALLYTKAGGLKLQVIFTRPCGGERNYALEAAQVPSDIRTCFDDAKPGTFSWDKNNDLDLYTFKPKNW